MKSKRCDNDHRAMPDVAHMLKQTGQQMIDLAGRLSDNGEPLNNYQQDLIKMVVFTEIKGLADEACMMFMAGHAQDASCNFEYIRDVVRDKGRYIY